MKTLTLSDLKYAPSGDPLNSHNLLTVADMFPTSKNSYKPARAMAASGYAVLATPVGASILKRSDGSVGMFVGTALNIFEANGSGAWTNRSKGGGPYTSATQWQFAVYGTTVIATNNLDTPQYATGAGATFADLTGAPKAKCIAVMSNAVGLFNYDGGTRYGDGWYTSDTGDFTSWTATAANAVASGRLTDTPGPINAAATMNDTFVVWKSRGMYIGRFVGGDIQWQWQLLNPDIGCVAPDAWTHTDAGIVFVSERDVFLYDGGSVKAIAGPDMRAQIFGGAAGDNLSSIKCTYEPNDGLVYIFVGSGGTTAYVWSHLTGKWGGEGIAGTYGSLSYSNVATVFRNPNYADEVARGVSTNSARCGAMVLDGSGNVVVFSGTNTVTGGILGSAILGSTQQMTLLRVTPIYLVAPSGNFETLSVLSGGTPNSITTTTTGKWDNTSQRFDIQVSAKYMAFTHTTDGEVSSYVIEYDGAGLE